VNEPESVVEAILKLVRSARPGQGNAETDKHVAWGPGPRASQALTLWRGQGRDARATQRLTADVRRAIVKAHAPARDSGL
jgi:hypothetical protein